MQKKNFIVYCHTNKINGKKYVGITGRKVKERWQNGRGYKTSIKFQNAINKYGWDGFEHEILHEGLTKEEAEELEIKYIAEWNLTDIQNGYNIFKGGHTPDVTETFREKMSIISKQKYIEHPELREEQSIRMKQYFKDNPDKIPYSMLGKHHSEETKIKISESNKGKSKGVRRSPETEFKKGQEPWNKGKKFSKKHTEAIKKDKVSKRKKVYCVELDKIFNSAVEVATELNVNKSTIVSCCKKRPHYKTAGGYHFVYVNEDGSVTLGDLEQFKGKEPKREFTKGHKFSEEHIKKLSESHKGQVPYNKGKKLGPMPVEHRRKRGKKVYCVELKKMFYSATEAGEKLNINRAHILSCCRGSYGFVTAGGYHWEYYKGSD